MKYFLLTACCLFLASLSFAYQENSMPDMPVPTQLDEQSLEANIVHRFFRIPGADFPDNFINLANVKLGLRYVPLPKVEVGTSFQFYKKEYTFHGAYSFFFPKEYLRAQARILFFGAVDDNDIYQKKWDHNFLYQVNLQSDPIAGLFLPVVDVSYNGLTEKVGLGTGLDIAILKNVDILGEYYPVLGTRDTLQYGKPVVNCFSAAVKLSTPGHHFMIVVSNNYDIGVRRLMAGTKDNTLYYGFNIQRLFGF